MSESTPILIFWQQHPIIIIIMGFWISIGLAFHVFMWATTDGFRRDPLGFIVFAVPMTILWPLNLLIWYAITGGLQSKYWTRTGEEA